jgi:hypothetical protein
MFALSFPDARFVVKKIIIALEYNYEKFPFYNVYDFCFYFRWMQPAENRNEFSETNYGKSKYSRNGYENV